MNFQVTPKLLLLVELRIAPWRMAAQHHGRPSALRPRCLWPDCIRRSSEGGYCAKHASMDRGAGPPSSAVPRAPRPVPVPKRQNHLGNDNPICVTANVDIDTYSDNMVETLALEGITLKCCFCGSWNFPAEQVLSGNKKRVTLCYKGGKLQDLPALPDTPEPLRTWLRGNDATSKHFRQHVRRYNAALSFVSFGASVEIKSSTPGTQAPPVAVIHGAVYHHSHPLRADDPANARFAQLYLYDAAEASQLRSTKDRVLRVDLLSQLAEMFHAIGNPYVEAYKRMGELTQAR